MLEMKIRLCLVFSVFVMPKRDLYRRIYMYLCGKRGKDLKNMRVGEF